MSENNTSGQQGLSVTFVWLAVTFCVCLVASNLFVPRLWQVGKLPLQLSGAVLIFPISYVINDLLTEVYGYRKAMLVIWMGYQMLPKIVLIVLVVFFPIAISLLQGFSEVDKDTVNLMRSMGANRMQIFRYVKLPNSLGHFFSSLKISVSYAVVSAVVSEWIGGTEGLGCYMTRVRKSFASDKMFAVIILISVISLILIWLTELIQHACMPWEKAQYHHRRSKE